MTACERPAPQPTGTGPSSKSAAAKPLASARQSTADQRQARDAALAYAAHGWPVFPLRGKVPALTKADGGRGFHDATTDVAVVAGMWARFPGANIGIRTGETSGLAVLDIDGEPGRDSLAHVEAAAGGPLPGTVTSITANGAHLLYTWQPGIGVGAAVYGPGLDVRGEGGYIVAPPSVHPSGHVYRWLNAGDAPDPWAHPLTPWPHGLPLARPPAPRPPDHYEPAPSAPSAPSAPGGPLAGLVRVVLAAEPGTRNERLNWAAYRAGEHIVRGRITPNAAASALLAAAAAVGLTEREAVPTIASGLGSAGAR